METKLKVLVITIGIITLLLGAMIGFLAGQNKITTKTANNSPLSPEQTQQLINAAYPQPPAEFYGFSGMVKEVKEEEILLEVYHPDDYLPVVERRKQIRTVGDDRGNLWIRTAPSAGADTVTWLVHGPAGERVGSVRMHTSWLPLDIRRDMLLLRETDADGVQTVSVRRVVP